MKTRQWAVTLGLVIVVGAAGAACKKKEGTSLDGKTFSVQVTEPGKGPQPDTLMFAGGKFDSTECRKYGFGLAPYTTKMDGKAVSFAVEAKSEKEGTNQWAGKIEGDRIQGTLEWMKPGQAPIKYTFEGSLAKK